MFNDNNISTIDPETNARERILSAARILFVDNGYKGTSIRDIASQSESNVAMVNYYFQSKYNLFEIVFEEAFDLLWDRIFSALNSEDDFYTQVKEWISAYYDVLTQYPQLPNFILSEISIDSQRLINIFQRHNPNEVFLKVSAKIKEEQQKGTITDTPPLDFMLNILSLSIFPFIFRNLAQPIAGVSNETYESMIKEHRDYVIEFVHNALRPIEEEKKKGGLKKIRGNNKTVKFKISTKK